MFRQYWQHNLVALLLVGGLVLSLPASVFSQSEEVDATPAVAVDTASSYVFLPLVQGETPRAPLVSDPTVMPADQGEAEAPVTASQRVFLPVIQAGLAPDVSAAGLSFDVCKTPAADAFRILDFFGVSSTSPDASYSQRVCKRWIMDVRVSSANQEFQFDSTNYPTSSPLCNAYRQQWSVYRKSLFQTSFTLVRSGTSRGLWNTAAHRCEMQPVTGAGLGAYIYQPPTAGYYFYRVAVGAYRITTFGNVWLPVTVGAEYFPIPE